MDNEILQNIWQNLSANNLTDTEFEDWTETFMNDTEVQENVHEYLFDNDLTESSFEEWSTNIGLKKTTYSIRNYYWQMVDRFLQKMSLLLV